MDGTWDPPLLEVRREGLGFGHYVLGVGVISGLCVLVSSLLVYQALTGWMSLEVMGGMLMAPVVITVACNGFLTYVRLLTPPAVLVLYPDRLVLRRDEGDRSVMREVGLDPSARVDLLFPRKLSKARAGPPYGLTVGRADRLSVDPFNGWRVDDFRRLLATMVPLIEEGRVRAGDETREYLATDPVLGT